MEVAYSEPGVLLLRGDVLEGVEELKQLGVKVNLIATSPPYWGLRNNKNTAKWWSNDLACPHLGLEKSAEAPIHKAGNVAPSKGIQQQQELARSGQSPQMRVFEPPPTKMARQGMTQDQKWAEGTKAMKGGLEGSVGCADCGAWYGSYGSEPILDCKRADGMLCSICYVCHTLLILRALRNLLEEDGVVFWNVGDNHIGSRNGSNDHRPDRQVGIYDGQKPGQQDGLKDTDVAHMPQRVAIALQDDGWYVKSDIVWVKGTALNKVGIDTLLKPYLGQIPQELVDSLHKNVYVGNGMPESVTNRPTRSYEMIYMLTKQRSPAVYMGAVREEHLEESKKRYEYGLTPTYEADGKVSAGAYRTEKMGDRVNSAGKNIRNVWMIPTKGMGWKLCTACDTVYDPTEYRRLPSRKEKVDWRTRAVLQDAPSEVEETVNHMGGGQTGVSSSMINITTCNCGREDAWASHFSAFPELLAETMVKMGSEEGDVILDPFAGSGTMLMAGKKMGREVVGIELSEEYARLASERIRRT